MDIIKIKDGLFNEELNLIVNYTEKELEALLMNAHGEMPDYLGVKASTIKSPDCTYYLAIKEFKGAIADIALLMHEIFHYTMMLLEDRGVAFCKENEEVFAYFMQQIAEKSLFELDKVVK